MKLKPFIEPGLLLSQGGKAMTAFIKGFEFNLTPNSFYLSPKQFMTLTKTLSRLFPTLAVILILISCNSKPEESEFTKSAREMFFDADLASKYEDAVNYYKGNSNLVDVKLFDSAQQVPDSKHQFIFQKHPMVKEGLKAGSLYVSRGMDDSAKFEQVLYFVSKEDAQRSLQAIDQKLRKSANHVVTSDSADRKMVIYSAGKPDLLSGIVVNFITDSAENQAQLKLNLVKSRN
jgi:hypothetical protein